MLHNGWDLPWISRVESVGVGRNARPRPLPRVRVLVVDDNRLFAEALMISLGTDDRFEIVAHALDGWEALELAAAFRPDVVLMELSMPGLDGIETTHRLRHLVPGARVIMLSASNEDEDVLRAAEAGAVLYLTKNCGMSEVLSSVLDVARRPTGVVFDLRRRLKLASERA